MKYPKKLYTITDNKLIEWNHIASFYYNIKGYRDTGVLSDDNLIITKGKHHACYTNKQAAICQLIVSLESNIRYEKEIIDDLKKLV